MGRSAAPTGMASWCICPLTSPGKLLKAEYILSSLINDNGATGVWKYAKESDRILVQSVCIQIRGQILQKLGMWYEAAELIWASVLGYFTLPQPDKKGIATSLGILADIFVSMSENDYNRFKNNSQINLNLLEEFDHRLLSAAEACKLAAAFSQFTPLFVLTAVNIRGVCLLSYSYSPACPSEKQKFYLSEAKESFEIGLLSKRDQKPATSKQELHSFVKAAFCLTKVHQRLYGESERLSGVTQLCQEALEKLYTYSHSTHAGKQDKDLLAQEIMSLVMSAKEQLQVQSFPNSDAKSYVPDSFKVGIEKQIVNGELNFKEVLKMHSQHHTAVCEVFESACRSHTVRQEEGRMGTCITALKTETRNMDTVCTTEERSLHGKDTAKISVSQKVRKGHESLKGQIRKKLSRVPAVDTSLDEETESEPSERDQSNGDGMSSRSQSRSEILSSLRSWSKWSKSSSLPSWEEVDWIELPQEKEQKTKGSTDNVQDHTAALTEDGGESAQEHNLCLLSSKTHNLSKAQNGYIGPVTQNNIAVANRLTESCPNVKEEQLEGTECEEDFLKQSLKELSNTSCRNSNLFSDGMNPSCEQDPSGMSIPSSDSRTKDSNKYCNALSSHNQSQLGRGSREDPKSCNQVTEPISKNHWLLVDPEGETVDATEDTPGSPHLPNHSMAPALVNSKQPERSCYIQNWINESVVMVTAGGSSEVPEVDPQAVTEDDWEFASGSGRKSVENDPDVVVIRNQQDHKSETTNSLSGRIKQLANQSSDCATTEEDEGDKLKNVFNRSGSSSSSLKSWYNQHSFSSSFSELGSPFLNSSGSSFIFMSRSKEQCLQARILSDDDYERLLAGVTHSWLVERLKNTGLFKPNQLQKAHSALLLKFSKKSGLWTAQETAVCIGDYLNVAKKGKQRNAFWIHFLHQEETLGRYVGKEYKSEKGLIHHFSDVERQMTAQYYVTEFNKRLYEQKIPTQIFYIPSVILLVLEGKTIQGCISVEPYILGEFVKLSNNTKVVKSEYKATEYGLAYGHFCYEFSQGTDVVVDLQGWVTGNGKGLIYLTDPQIHSVSQKDMSYLTNFGKKGIYYFFNDQHVECNEICHRLSLTRPSIENLK
ncbi:alpha-protein kinase 1 isoform X1 [Tiliqua scincoides]|uniref:alpha-protein kinase 1 isoform X1 n=1 Tax=Tiliqua scincoides TaxID=71010 RepID=UPI0034635FF4